MVKRTSNLAPTSMPRVGSSRMSTFGLRHSQRASITFCWLPPESVPTFCPGPVARMCSRSMNRSTISLTRFSETNPARESRGSAAMAMLSRIDRFGRIPSSLRSSGQQCDPGLDRGAG